MYCNSTGVKICVGSNKLDVSFGEKEINPQGFTWELNSGPSDYQSDALTTETLEKDSWNQLRPLPLSRLASAPLL